MPSENDLKFPTRAPGIHGSTTQSRPKERPSIDKALIALLIANLLAFLDTIPSSNPHHPDTDITTLPSHPAWESVTQEDLGR